MEVRDRVVKIKRDIEDMDRFEEEEEMKKITPVKNTWYDWLINYISKTIRKNPSVLKDKFISLFKTITSQKTVYERRKKLSKPRKQNIEKPFIPEENKEKSKGK